MNIRSCITLFSVALLTCPLICGAGQTEAIEQQSIIDADNQTEFNRLHSKAVNEGSIQVMVVLKDTADNDVLPKDKAQEEAQENP